MSKLELKNRAYLQATFAFMLLALSGCTQKPQTGIYNVLDQAGANTFKVVLTTTEGTETLFLDKQPLVTIADFQEAGLSLPDSEHPAILVRFTPVGQEKIRLATRNSVNKRIAVVLYGKPLNAPIVKTVINSDTIIIASDIPANEIKSLAERLQKDIKK